MYSDWLEIASAAFAVLTFGVALWITRGQDQSNKRFIQSQINEKIAVIYSYADGFNEVFQKNQIGAQKNPPERYSISPHLIERITTDLQAVNDLTSDIPRKKREPLKVALNILLGEMEGAGYTTQAQTLRSSFRSLLA